MPPGRDETDRLQQKRAQRQSTATRADEPWYERWPILREISAPSLDDTVFLGGMAVLVAGTLIEWPIAAVIGVAHLLTRGNTAAAKKKR